MAKRVALLPGDGIGPDVVASAVRVLRQVFSDRPEALSFQYHLLGGSAIDETGQPFPEETRAAVLASDAVLLGAVGGPKWDKGPGHLRPEAGLLALRKTLGVYANMRPVRAYERLLDASPLRLDVAKGVDLLIIRELTGGIYFGERERGDTALEGRFAKDTMYYTEMEIRRVVKKGFEAARDRKGHLTSVDKANVLDSSRLWREVVDDMKKDFPDVTVEHVLVDSCAMHLVTRPERFDVIVTENLFGDILSDEAAVLTGSIGVLPSASLGDGPGLYEPIHGSAPDIAGKGIANPLGTILSAAMMLRHSLAEPERAERMEAAVSRVIDAGLRTADLARGQASVSTNAMTDAVIAALL
ncbi:3-isopropylmalate dehydrogenase [Ferroacidibacillus organovorans]|uniref:3-isopropylmalate dehydrogenase n=1 Tax=Ferroacidibacillus organovorans TaxID=1765683 RepID=A0A853KEA2_9BACL|nr:3-isopropylmalate dehydrogenase [Ferroacidibacillus organovorans]KYP80920.1 3-isopropylmalate dehydrogenase [Ferroacidibacillus organovorans]OAG95352.1 3-isopropylmalate dehydrogenase [Ferroacidibacillus organovorans]